MYEIFELKMHYLFSCCDTFYEQSFACLNCIYIHCILYVQNMSKALNRCQLIKCVVNIFKSVLLLLIIVVPQQYYYAQYCKLILLPAMAVLCTVVVIPFVPPSITQRTVLEYVYALAWCLRVSIFETQMALLSTYADNSGYMFYF